MALHMWSRGVRHPRGHRASLRSYVADELPLRRTYKSLSFHEVDGRCLRPASSAMSLLASLRSLGSHLSCPGGPLSLRAGIGQALGPAAAQMFVRGMKVRSALKKRCEATLKTRSASGCTTVQQAPEKLPGHPKASAAIFQPWPTSLGTLLPVAASAVLQGSPWWPRHPLLSITPGARRAT